MTAKQELQDRTEGEDLFCWFAEAISLNEAVSLTLTLEGRSLLLAYSPTWCGFASLNDSKTLIQGGKFEEKKISDCFELRIFHPRFELRWAIRGSETSKGQAFFTTEEADIFMEPPFARLQSDQRGKSAVFFRGEGKYLLWGTKKDFYEKTEREGWVSMYDHRINTLQIPFSSDRSSKQVYLRYFEYFTEDAFGNLEFAFEQLRDLC
nr:CRISPR-associated protein Csx19 [uncultured Dethiosulfovibrio sp.]